MLTLNLENVDSPEAWDCPLVLTSPRSLAACRLLDVKPVELLPNDIMNLAETTGTGDLAKLADLRDLLEHRRRTKLEHCRAIRRYLISQNAVDEHQLIAAHTYEKELENLSEEDSSAHDENIYRSNLDSSNRCSVTFQRRSPCSRKERLDIQNRAVAQERKKLSRESSARPPSRHFLPPTRPSSTRPVLVDCFGRTNFSQSCVENEAMVPRRSQPRRKTRSGKRSETPFSDKVTSSTDRDTPLVAKNVPRSTRSAGPSRPPSSLADSHRQTRKKIPSESLSETEPKNDAEQRMKNLDGPEQRMKQLDGPEQRKHFDGDQRMKYFDRPEQRMNHFTTPESPMPNLDLPKQRTKSTDGLEQRMSHFATPESPMPNLDLPKQRMKYVDGPEQRMKYVDVPEQRIKHPDGPKQPMQNLDAPEQHMKNSDGPEERLKNLDGPEQRRKNFDGRPNGSNRKVNRPQSANISESVRTATPREHRRKSCKRPRRRTRSLSANGRLIQCPTPQMTLAPPPAPPLSAFGTDLSETGGHRDRSSKCLLQQIRIKTPQYFVSKNKIAALGTQWRRTAEAVGLSEEDQKILRLLEKKALEKRAFEMTAEAARILWEREEEQRTKQQEWEKERLKFEVAERRKEDMAETKRRLAYIEKNFNRAQRRLADTLRRRDEEAQQRLAKIALQKDAMRAEKKAADLARQASAEKRLKHLNQEFQRHLNFQAEGLEARMRNAEGRREWCSSSAVERRHTTSASLLVLPSSPEQCLLRKRPSSAPRPTSATSDPRIVSARMVRDAIERNLAASRVRHVVQSEAAVQAAASRASARIKARSTRVRITWTRRRLAHLASAARLRAMRGAAVARLRNRIRAGERKIAALLAAKERSVASSRAAAAVAAQLRQNLRGTLSPTTFDRMASDVQNVLRIPSSSRSWTAEHHSVTHIKLG